MNNKHKKVNAPSRKSRKAGRAAGSQPASTVQTPFAQSGGVVGKALGGLLGNPRLGASIGKWLGSGIGTLFGSGDYVLGGPSPSRNVLTNAGELPQFASSGKATLICHREYLGDISGTTAFSPSVYAINPGISSTFPWLSTVAQNFEEYKLHGLVFEFKSLSSEYISGGYLGAVVMATQYNANNPPFGSKLAMENYDWAVSNKPSQSMIHGVECKRELSVLGELYVRTGNISTDLRFSDLGTFTIATQGQPTTAVIGELWVSYCVELLKPKLPITVGGDIASFHAVRSATSASTVPLGTIGVATYGTLPASVTTTSVSWPTTAGTVWFFLSKMWDSTSSNGAGIALSGGTLLPKGYNQASAYYVSTGGATYSAVIVATGSAITVSFPSLAAATSAATNVDVYVSQFDSTIQ